ncbi:MAG: hypothetical protein ISS87_00355 [Candidatus Pacebacteria bacterium]|nr:hypothetical protein [Candidatus Paceibacterota bacterium]
MKTVFSVLCLLVLLSIMVGCGTSDTPAVVPTETPVTTPTQKVITIYWHQNGIPETIPAQESTTIHWYPKTETPTQSPASTRILTTTAPTPTVAIATQMPTPTPTPTTQINPVAGTIVEVHLSERGVTLKADGQSWQYTHGEIYCLDAVPGCPPSECSVFRALNYVKSGLIGRRLGDQGRAGTIYYSSLISNPCVDFIGEAGE